MQIKITLQVGVKALLKKDGKYLLIRRSLIKYPEVTETRWDIVGGRINPGDTLIDNLKREIKEETNLELVGEPRLMAAQDILRIAGRHVVRLTYIGEVTGELVLDQEEHDNYRWQTIAEMKACNDIDIYFKELLDKGLIN